jgi:16S rRNA (adenine(1408)-N(1))-methyltransferase
LLKILKNKKITEVNNLEDLYCALDQFKEIHIDIGTGNGKFVYDLAIKDPYTLFIGIEPTASNLYEYSKKANKNKLNNLIYVISSIENLEDDLNGLADKIYINFPWGSLLEVIVKDMTALLNKISLLGKIGAEFHFTFAYSTIHEPMEIEKRKLPILTEEYLYNNIKEIYSKAGLVVESCINIKPLEVNRFGTLWAKKLFLGKSRDVYKIISRKK